MLRRPHALMTASYSYFQIFLVNLNLSRMPQVPVPMAGKAKKAVTEMDVATDICIAIRKRCYLFMELLDRLTAMFNPLIDQMESAIADHQADFSQFSQEQKNAVACAASLAGSVKAVIDTPILTEKGELTKESADIIRTINNNI